MSLTTSNTDTTRQHIKLLPAVNQTKTLARFFGSTVDQVFQPGSYAAINAYIGDLPDYDNATTDFYVGEPTYERSVYQLEPSMISINNSATIVSNTSDINYALTYPDLVAYISSQGGLVNNQTRLFENNYYSWSPPIDIDKLNNFTQYYWFGDYSGAKDLPILTLTVPFNTFIGDGSTVTFALPNQLGNVTSSQETIAVYVNSVKVSGITINNTVSNSTSFASSVTLPLAPLNGDQIVVSRYDDLSVAIVGQVTFNLVPFIDSSIDAPNLTSGMRIFLQDTSRLFGGWSNSVMIGNSNQTYDVLWDETYLSDESIVHDRSLWDLTGYDTFMVDGVGKSIRLTPDDLMYRELSAQYITIDRSSVDRNPWSLKNNWVHKDSFAWSGQVFTNRQAFRPIIEFVRDILLYNYGVHRIDPIDGVLSTTNAMYNNTSIPFSAIAGKPMGSVTVDNGVKIFPGMRLLVAQKTFINQQLYLVGESSGNIALTPLAQNNGDIAIINAPSGYGGTTVGKLEMWFDGRIWKVAQTWVESAGETTDPLFCLFDLNGVALDNQTTYLNSQFAGSRIFGYAKGVGTNDIVLHRPLKFDNNGAIVFENDVVTRRAETVTNQIVTEIKGLYCYETVENNKLINGVYYGVPLCLWNPITGYSTQVIITTEADGTAYWSIPLNLEANPNSQDIDFISKSDWVYHFSDEISQQIGFTGTPLGDNNYRDTLRDLSLGDRILQHVAPLLKTMLLASEPNFDYFTSVRFIDSEYNLFRNKFVRKLIQFDLNGTMPIGATAQQWVTAVLVDLKKTKSATFPFALSTMGGGNYFIPATPAFLGVIPSYKPMMLMDDTYPSPILMIRGHDGSLTSAFNDWRDPIMLQLEQQIYDSIPAHYVNMERPVFDLEYYLGGRFTPTNTGPFVTDDPTYVAVKYTRGETQSMLAPIFERWCSLVTRLDYRTNTTFDQNNPFSWNYRGIADQYGTQMPGHWKAIYRFYFDTVRPHSHPWEMLGFTDMPSWWTSVYGAAPYLSTNTALWSDLEGGIIRQGTRAGFNVRYARPGLSKVIPVDATGKLLDPVSAKIVKFAPNYGQAGRNWVNGDGGPVEDLWLNSPAYRYALAQIAFMAKPARLVEMCWDSVNYGYSPNGQWIDYRTLQRPQNADNFVHGETNTITGALTVVYGIQQWIADYMTSQSQTTTTLGNAVRGLDVRLLHRMASFLTTDNLSAIADNFGVVPSEDLQVLLYTSPTLDTEVYSGVIVEWSGEFKGWTVIGYDARNPYFTIIPPDMNGPKGVISLATTQEPTINPWTPNTYYRVGQFVYYQTYTYEAVSQHLSAAKFEERYWTAVSVDTKQAPRVIKYLNGLMNATNQVLYGTVFTTIQDVADFLFGWERYLISRGWTFDVMAADGTIQNWTKSVKDFLTWTQVNWAPGNFIALSPGAAELHFIANTGTILNVEDSTTGYYGMLDRSGAPIMSNSVIDTRLDGDLTLVAENADIFCARVRIADIEHALVFSNITIFNDPIYLPLFNMRQPRLKILGNRTTNWYGRLSAPGFIIEGNSLTPNFDRNVQDIQVMYDIEQSLRKEFTDYARHNIGYQARDYLEDLLISEVEQFEFYQGMIQQKGAPSVFSALLRSSRVSANSDIEFLEEYAIRTSIFGGPLDPRITLIVNQIDVKRNPQIILLGNYPQSDPTWLIMQSTDAKWIDKPTTTPFFTALPPPDPTNMKPNQIPSAGHLRLNDADYTMFYLSEAAALYNNSVTAGVPAFTTGQRVWVYDDFTNNAFTWNVYEIFETGTQPNYISNCTTTTEDPTVIGLRIFFSFPINLTNADVGKTIVIDGMAHTSPEIQGIQTIEVVNTVANWIEIAVDGTAGFDFANTTATTLYPPNVRIFDSVRFPTYSALETSTLRWTVGDMVWIDSDVNYNNLWTVYKSNSVTNGVSTWTNIRIQPPHVDPTQITQSMIYDISTQIANQQISVNKPIINDLVIVDPIAGKLPGVAEDEIDFQTQYDPAKYSSSLVYNISIDAWGNNEVGRVWWDLSTVRFLDPYTDQIGISNSRDLDEINYRSANWATVAPDTSVDVYEWIKSTLSPDQYTANVAAGTAGYIGTIFNADQPSYTQTSEYSAAYGKDITYYYYWVKGLTTTPNVKFRSTSVSDIASILTSPTSQDVPWFAPIMQDGMLISGATPYLNDTSTVLKVAVTNHAPDAGHSEYLLMRPKDETSLPPDWLWRAVTNGLSQFDERVHPLPSLTVNPYRAVGTLAGQNIFKIDGVAVGDRLGLLGARESFVGIVNNILAQTPVVYDRAAGVALISRNTPINQYLIWTRPDDSYVIEPPPINEFDFTVYSNSERNKLMLRPEFGAALTTGKTIRVLIDGTNLQHPQWSIWWFNPSVANQYLILNATRAQPLPIVEALFNNADAIFSLGTSYEYSVPTYAARNLLTGLNIGDRVYVVKDETTETVANNGFWIVYKYEPSDPTADAFGFIVHRVQSYQTSDFYKVVDWYYQDFNNGYQTVTFSANNPPQITYSSIDERDANEGLSPVNSFVEIQPDTGGWFWQYYLDGALTSNSGWVTVAREAATIALSTQFYTGFLNIHAVNTIAKETIFNRDGSWEIKVLANALRKSGILLNLEVNEVFFSLVHYIHSQQNDIDWIFKTSFMVVAGYSVPLTQTGIQTEDISNSLISYIEEVKPYHVKIRDYTTQYTPPVDDMNVHMTDFDKPVYFDNTISAYRKLQTPITGSNAANNDLSILSTKEPWVDWYDNYTKPMTQNTNGYWSNPVRHMNITLLFDRVTNLYADNLWDGDVSNSVSNVVSWDAIGWDGGESGANTAAERIMLAYLPLTGMQPIVPISGLIDTLYRYPAATISGNDIANATYDIDYDGNSNSTNISVSINPNDITSGIDSSYNRYTNGVTSAFVDKRHPEERISTISDDGITIKVDTYGSPGAPIQRVQSFNVSGIAYAVLMIDQIAQSDEGIFVYIDGLRANIGMDYTIDYFDKIITMISTANNVLVRSFGFGGDCGIVEQHFVSYANAPISLMSTPALSDVQVIIDGNLQNSSQFTVGGSEVLLLTTPNTGADVAVIVWDGNAANTCVAQRQIVEFGSVINFVTGFGVFDLEYPDVDTLPPHAGTMVEVNGLRLTPPLTYYGVFDKNNRYMTMDFDISSNTTIDLVIDGVYYPNATVPRWNSYYLDGTVSGNPFNLISDLSNYPPDTIPGRFVLYDRYLVATDSTFMSKNVIAVFNEFNNPLGANIDYQVIGNTILIADNIIANANEAIVTTFTNAGMMNISTHTFFGALDGSYKVRKPFDEQYSIVTFDKKMLTPELDYDFTFIDDGFGQYIFDGPFGQQYNAAVLTIPVNPSLLIDNKPIVAMLFAGRPAEMPSHWRLSTTTSSIHRMEQAIAPGGWDEDYWDAPFTQWDVQNAAWQFDYPRYPGENTNPVQVYQMDYRWVCNNQDPLKTGKLIVSLEPTDTTITISLDQLSNTSSKLWPIHLIPVMVNNVIIYQWTGEVFPLPDVKTNKVGAVWVGDERIEYQSLDYEPSSYSSMPSTLTPPNIVLSGIRRGTQGTSNINENRVTEVILCDGNTTTFTINAAGTVELKIAQSNATSNAWTAYAETISNSVTSFTADHIWPTTNDYSISGNSPQIIIMNNPPAANAYISIGVTTDYAHHVGTLVTNGVDVFTPMVNNIPLGHIRHNIIMTSNT